MERLDRTFCNAKWLYLLLVPISATCPVYLVIISPFFYPCMGILQGCKDLGYSVCYYIGLSMINFRELVHHHWMHDHGTFLDALGSFTEVARS